MALEVADLLVVERGVVVRTLEETVVGDDGDLLRFGLRQRRGDRRGVDRVEDDDVDAFGDSRFELLLLLGGVLVGVAVFDLGVGVGLGDVLLEVRFVEGFVPGRLRLGQEQGDRHVAVGAGTGAGFVIALALLVAAAGECESGDRNGGADDGEATMKPARPGRRR